MAFNEDKTKIEHLDEGVDFLGFTIRQFHGGKLLINPSKNALGRLREWLATEVRTLRGSNAAAVIARLNPIIPGMGGLLPDGDIKQDLPHGERLRVATALPHPPKQAEKWTVTSP